MPYREPSVPAQPVARRCPSCRLINPPGTPRCDCGYVFLTREQGSPTERYRNERRSRAANVLALTGLYLMILAMFIPIPVFAASYSGWLTFISWAGCFAAGVSMMLIARHRSRRRR